jgi:hypothetical protein
MDVGRDVPTPSAEKVARIMHSTYQAMPQTLRRAGTHRGFGLTDPTVIESYASRRAEDPSLLSAGTGPSYADFFAEPTL